MAIEFEKELKKMERAEFSLAHLQIAGAKAMSLDAFVSEEHQDTRYIDRLASNSFEQHEQDQQLMDIRQRLSSVLGKLTEREREVITRVYGLNDAAPITLEELGLEFDLTRERVRQIKERGIRKLKNGLAFKNDMRNVFENLAHQ